MPDKNKTPVAEKNGLHPRNKHRSRYNFDALVLTCPELEPFVSLNKFNDQSVDFSDPQAVKMLNAALLRHFYKLSSWDIPEGYLCPPIPGRADYIHYVADLLALYNYGNIPGGKTIKVLDIGVGANCVYPLIGNHEYGWSFVGTDIDSTALESAQKIVTDNKLADVIELRKQTNVSGIYTGVINPGELFDVAICNPPFHSSQQEAEQANMRKQSNLGKAETDKPMLNFGGQNTELWYPGGESAFISKMIYQSSKAPQQCFWYTTLVSQKDNLHNIYKALKKVNVFEVQTINMAGLTHKNS
ncbi:23S rRNA m(6)A-1618 methyltransferase [Mucilaginibacter gracilis]|uniref:Ribosomal RNA large subunit methyltransferase F n=1 Tax=Mucilaginibacter gracilis TaxID=423350 RepID=A0A495J391_9SPHI|nr:23S rRNA (adenine(1618)-N(6))-methyltransferase RlmF [Mucilaginibacter gracilis]RKR83430.1 23S rRNA m(6)A-1618 methyltransferase [Mucilaginibacter gracilis]